MRCFAPWCGPFFFNDTATTEIYTLSLHDALPICILQAPPCLDPMGDRRRTTHSEEPWSATTRRQVCIRSEEHTSELQSRQYLVCRLLLEKKTTTSLEASHSVLQLTSLFHLMSCEA